MVDPVIEDAPLTAAEILLFGPCVEAQVWTPMWLQEARAPIAVAAGRPKLGKVFDDNGVGKAVVIRPCMSRGARIRGLPPIYTPQMLEKHANVFDGWPMFLDHAPRALAEKLAKQGRSVRELGGQLLKGGWSRDFVHEDDAQYGYQKGAVLAEVWATPLVRSTVGENPNLLHTSINAWPTSGKPGPAPWRAGSKGMVIEGIRRQPQGSVDFVVRGGAGGRLLVAEGMEDEGAWPEIGEMSEADVELVVSLAESLYASPRMSDLVLPSDPSELREWLQEHAPNLVPALGEAAASGDGDGDADDKGQGAKTRKRSTKSGDESMAEGLTEADVKRIMQETLAEANANVPSVEDFEQHLREVTEETLNERDQQRSLSARAVRLIEGAEGIPAKWKGDLIARYSMLPSGPPATLLVEAETDEDGKALTPEQVLEARVTADLEHVRDLIAEAQGKPRVTGEGGQRRDPADSPAAKASASHWRDSFASMGIAESADNAGEMFGMSKVEG